MKVHHPAASPLHRIVAPVLNGPLLSAVRAGAAAFGDDWRRSRTPASMVLIDLDCCGVKAAQVRQVVDHLRGLAGRHAMIFAAGSLSTHGHKRACKELGVVVLPSGTERDSADNALLARARIELQDREVNTYIVSRDAGFCRLARDYKLVLFGDAEQASRRLRERASAVLVIAPVPA